MTEITPTYKSTRKSVKPCAGYCELMHTRVTKDMKAAMQLLTAMTGCNEATIIRMCVDAHIPKLQKKALITRQIEQQFISESKPDYSP